MWTWRHPQGAQKKPKNQKCDYVQVHDKMANYLLMKTLYYDQKPQNGY